MPRSANPTTSRLARVRQHFGLQQSELALLLGITQAQVSRLEGGRRALSPELAERLAPWLAALETATLATETPLTDQAAAPPGSPPPGPLDAAPLLARRRICLHEAATLRKRLGEVAAQALVAEQRAAAEPALRATLGPVPPAPTTPEAVRLRFAHAWLDTVPLALLPHERSTWHLLHQRAQALEAEAAALGALV